MCGIAGFLANANWQQNQDADWLSALAQRAAALAVADAAGIEVLLDDLAGRFNELMSFATHMSLVQSPALAAEVAGFAARLGNLERGVKASAAAREPRLEKLAERLRDYGWQLEHELTANVGRTLALMADRTAPRPAHFVAWGVEQVLENLDRLEVRGRDSAGIAVQIVLGSDTPPAELAALADAAAQRPGFDQDGSAVLHALADGGATIRFTYKTAQLIGKLGDNGATIRAKIAADALLWRAAARAAGLGVLAHTRWASHGAINLANCHPLNGRLLQDNGPLLPDADAVTVLNGDVDNYRGLKDGLLAAAGLSIPPDITTDLKIIPLAFRLQPDATGREDRFLAALRRLEGSVAIGLLHPQEPQRLFLGQKGSGQSLFVAETADGLIFASENYGLAPRARASTALAQIDKGGLCVVLSTAPGEPALAARSIDDGAPAALQPRTIEIFSRDIFRGDFAHFFEKEVHESASSVAKTLSGRYRRSGRSVSFDSGDTHGLWAGLRGRLSDPDRPAIRRIFVTGQGTAAIAGSGVAHLLRQALAGSPVHVEAAKASELSGDLEGKRLDDALVIAISQSGTTTDTNRTVDLARAAGAWIHAIVNRRNSPLVQKSDSHLFTSDGRDIEMAVASTKAFYSQVTAGKLTALCLADCLGTLPANQIHDELVALEGLPARIQEVLNDEQQIAACAEAYAPWNRYWAVVGNGPNKIAAEEIRIKLSELCYKSIPVDFTEDKKHIDLSTEPLTIVVANDMPAELARDTAKEVAIFKAHAGKPLVIAAKGESCFDAYAEAIIRVPSVGAGLDFVLATVAGHLWGFHAARAIDRRSLPFRALGVQVEAALTDAGADLSLLAAGIATELTRIAGGELDAALPPRAVAQLAAMAEKLRQNPAGAARIALLDEAAALLRKAFEETSRPIDTIRHQAKTVTVGISRPGKELSPLLAAALSGLGVELPSLAPHDRKTLLALSAVVTSVPAAMVYTVTATGPDNVPSLQAGARLGAAVGVGSGYDRGRVPAGSKRRAVRLGRAVFSTGPEGRENLLFLPVFGGADWSLQGLALLHLELVPQASLQQKTALLKDLGLYEDMYDAYHEAVHGEARDFAAFLAGHSPRDLIFLPVSGLLG